MNNKLKKLTHVLMVSAGILAVDNQSLFAQSGTQESTVKKNKQSTASQSSGKAMSKTASAGFAGKAAESNLAEIELSKVALQNASSQQVKDYAQQMIDHHTMAQQELASILSGNTAMHGDHAGSMAGKKAGAGDDANAMDKNEADKMNSAGNSSGSGNASGATTGTGSTYSSGNASGATGTQGTTSGAGGTTADNTVGATSGSGTTGGTNAGTGAGSTYNSSSTGGGGAGANAGGTTSSTNAGVGSDPRRSQNTGASTTGDDSKERRVISSDNGADPTNNATMDATNMMGDMPVELSAEHKALKSKLSALTGADFDRQYIQAMVKDHAKAVALFEKQSKSSDDAALQAYAVKTLPVIKQHYQMAQKLSGTKASGTKSSSK